MYFNYHVDNKFIMTSTFQNTKENEEGIKTKSLECRSILLLLTCQRADNPVRGKEQNPEPSYKKGRALM